MAQQQQAAQPRPAEAVQEGNRWVWAQPKPEDFVTWFAENVHLHDGMTHDRYVQGVVLIGSKEKRKITRVTQQGQPMLGEEERLVFTPYAKVETRVAYFYDLMAEKKDDWLGIIEPVPVAQLTEAGVYNVNMPPGFFRLPIAKENNQRVDFIGCAKRVRILDRSTVEVVEVIDTDFDAQGNVVRQTRRRSYDGIPIAEFSPATKMVSTLGRYGEDPFSMMKAETGAVGRALGMAGMLVIPGSGIATAEDMQEALAGAGGVALEGTNVSLESEDTAAAGPEGAAAGTTGDSRPLSEQIPDMLKVLEEDYPAALEEAQAWAREKKLRLNDLTEAQQRSVHRKLGQILERVRTEAAEREAPAAE
jgi:hypothetical protein